jgi:glycosyltransferase involved in cell wall biosynthesis
MGPVVVAIPARNEADRIEPCLVAVAAQTRPPDTVVLLLNNCDDASEATARSISPRLPFRLEIVSVALAPARANAGSARRLAMRHAAKFAGGAGVLLTTDADARVPPGWVRRNIAALTAGADAVCGRIVVDPVEARAIPDHLHDDDALETELLDLLDEIAFTLDPEPHDSRPRHTQASGASLAVAAEMFRRVGGVPNVAYGEDRALIDALIRIDARVRHDPSIVVVVSGRLDGRAPGGMADTIRRRMLRQDEFTDDQVEPPADRYRRIDFRRRARFAWRERQPTDCRTELAADLRLAPERLNSILSARYFGTAWASLQRESPVLPRRRVSFADLPRQIEIARQLLEHDSVADESGKWSPLTSSVVEP